ncbi:hypothetical protein FQR65_LT17412 [Abscondita terminalis]|nr:hypothetical protein FQR65_LT17412 [Abscondita terminalis]
MAYCLNTLHSDELDFELLSKNINPERKTVHQKRALLRAQLALERNNPKLVVNCTSDAFDIKNEIACLNSKLIELGKLINEFAIILDEANLSHISIEFGTDSDLATKAFLTLPFLFATTTLKRGNKSKATTTWRPSRVEVQESFFFRVKDIENLDTIVDRRQRKLEQLGFPMLPFGVMIGRNQFFVIYEGIRCEVQSCIRTVTGQ